LLIYNEEEEERQCLTYQTIDAIDSVHMGWFREQLIRFLFLFSFFKLDVCVIDFDLSYLGFVCFGVRIEVLFGWKEVNNDVSSREKRQCKRDTIERR